MVACLSSSSFFFFFFNDTATTEIYTLSLHDALPISSSSRSSRSRSSRPSTPPAASPPSRHGSPRRRPTTCAARSEEHTSELQSRLHLVCRLLLEKKKQRTAIRFPGLISEVV